MLRLFFNVTVALHFAWVMAQADWPLPQTPPAKAGFSAERLKRLEEYCEELVTNDLLTHTAGFYSPGNTPGVPVLAELWKSNDTSPQTLTAMAERLARFPLQAQPGEAWIYGPSTDIVGALVERVSGKPFEQFLVERIFQPLKIRDTSFVVPETKRSRQVFMDRRQEDGRLRAEPPKPRGGSWASGGGGLYSTPADYARFAQMLLNRGELEGARILSPKTVKMMARDHLHIAASTRKNI